MSQNIFGDGFGISFNQPILTWHPGGGLDLGLAELQFTYDWELEEWVSLPLGIQVGYLTKVAKQPVRFFAAGQYNFRDLAGVPRNLYQLGLVLLVP